MAAAGTSEWVAPPAPKVLPMVMIPAKITQENSSRKIGRFYSVFEGKFYDNITIELPVPTFSEDEIETTSYCCGCGNGWLAEVVTDIEFAEFPLINLFNPLCQEVPIRRLPSVDFILPEGNIKVNVSGDLTSNQDNYVAIALSINTPSLAFIEGGQKDWTPCITEERSVFSDAILYKGQVYAVETETGMIVSFDVKSMSSNIARRNESGIVVSFDWKSSSNWTRRHKAKIEPTTDMKFRRCVRAYLVKSTKGDILHVRRFLMNEATRQGLNNEDEWQVTESFFMVYKLVFNDIDGSIVQQVEVKSIEDEALFVGDHSPSMSVLASRYLGCQPNSIYYIDDSRTVLEQLQRASAEVPFSYHMAGIFNLEDGTSAQLYSQRYYWPEFATPRALWFMLPFDLLR